MPFAYSCRVPHISFKVDVDAVSTLVSIPSDGVSNVCTFVCSAITAVKMVVSVGNLESILLGYFVILIGTHT